MSLFFVNLLVMTRYFWFFMAISLTTSFAYCRRLALHESAKKQLITDLTEIRESDQKYRNEASELRVRYNGVRSKKEGDLWAKQSVIDSINMLKIEKLINDYGYPGADKVGEELKSVAAFVILHNPNKQEKYLNLLWKESRQGNVDKREVAILDDRINMLKGKKQKYGTAMKYEPDGVDSLTGATKTKLAIWPIASFKDLDRRRERVGWYSFKLQCEIGGIDWKQFKDYTPQKNEFDFELK